MRVQCTWKNILSLYKYYIAIAFTIHWTANVCSQKQVSNTPQKQSIEKIINNNRNKKLKTKLLDLYSAISRMKHESVRCDGAEPS